MHRLLVVVFIFLLLTPQLRSQELWFTDTTYTESPEPVIPYYYANGIAWGLGFMPQPDGNPIFTAQIMNFNTGGLGFMMDMGYNFQGVSDDDNYTDVIDQEMADWFEDPVTGETRTKFGITVGYQFVNEPAVHISTTIL